MQPPDLVVRNKDEKIWVTRSTSGQYVRHFLEYNLVAIGHLDKFDLIRTANSDRKFEFSVASLEKLLSTDAEMAKAQRTSHLSQIRQFLSEMKSGDFVVTLDSSSFAIGRISGFPYFDDSPLPMKVGRELKTLPYQLRMPVKWGPRLSRRDLPLPLERVFFSHRTVFEITEYWQYIYHVLYPAFVDNDELFLSLYIGQIADIRTRDISRLINMLSDFEYLAAEFGEGDFYDTLTLKASFFSKGPFWPRLKAKERKALLYNFCILSMLAGTLSGFEVGPLKVNGILSTEAAKIFAQKLTEILKSNNSEDVKKGLILKTPETQMDSIKQRDTTPKNQQTITLAGL